MKFNLPLRVRFALYVAVSVASPVVAYLSETNRISESAVTLFVALITFVAGLAAVNTK